MATLEDRILKQNVPGQWMAMDDQTDRRGERDYGADGDTEDADATGPADEQEERRRTETDRLLNHSLIDDSVKIGIMGERARKKQTGIKGVLADYAAEQQLKQAEREAKAAQREAVLHRIAYGATAPNPHPQAAPVDADSEGDDLDDDDEAFMEQFRAARLRELQSQAVEPAQPQFGHVDTLSSQADLLAEVAACDPRTTVVVHMFEPSVSACVLLNRHLEELAGMWHDVRFFRIQASDTDLQIDRVALPAISVYRNGDILTVLAGLVEELGDRFGRDDVEWLLESSDGWTR